MLSTHVQDAIRNARIEPDERGLMPLARARAIVRAASEFRKGKGGMLGGTWVLQSDRLWAALLSLADADEFVREASRLRWFFHPRGQDDTAALERYGSAILAWLLGFVREGVLVNVPWCVVPCLLRIDRPEVFEALWSVRTVIDGVGTGWPGPFAADDVGDADRREGVNLGGSAPDEPDGSATSLVIKWITAHPAPGYAALSTRAAAGDTRARHLLCTAALLEPSSTFAHVCKGLGHDAAARIFDAVDAPRELEPHCVLQGVYAWIASGPWPVFAGVQDEGLEPPFLAYHALRMVVAREKDSEVWGIVFERLEGSNFDTLCVHSFMYSSRLGSGQTLAYPRFYTDDDFDEPRASAAIDGIGISGAAGELALRRSMLRELDLRPNVVTAEGVPSSRFAVLLRAYLATHPRVFWSDAREVASRLSFERDFDVIVDCDAFEHILGADRDSGPDGYDARWRVDPDRSSMMQSLARAVVARDGSLFEPGEPNTDWRLHARFEPEDDASG